MQSILRFSALIAVLAAMVIAGGCSTISKSTAVTYSYEPRFSFPQAKTYKWDQAKPTYRQDSLLEANVRFLADRQLAAKGLTSRTDKADLLVWIAYDFDPYYSGYGYDLRALTLNVSRADDNQLVWRGLATGAIKTDAASGELKKAVEEMLVNFPPK
jgi:Domain of unknown function (DUF4136)